MTLDQFETAIDLCQQQFDAVVDSGTDEDLFISSYLAGHFDLIVGQALMNQDYAFERLNRQLIQSLNNAFSSDNLSTHEQEKTTQLWLKLSQNFRH